MTPARLHGVGGGHRAHRFLTVLNHPGPGSGLDWLEPLGARFTTEACGWGLGCPAWPAAGTHRRWCKGESAGNSGREVSHRGRGGMARDVAFTPTLNRRPNSYGFVKQLKTSINLFFFVMFFMNPLFFVKFSVNLCESCFSCILFFIQN